MLSVGAFILMVLPDSLIVVPFKLSVVVCPPSAQFLPILVFVAPTNAAVVPPLVHNVSLANTSISPPVPVD